MKLTNLTNCETTENKNIIFGALTRDSGSYLQESIDALKRLGSFFSYYKIIIYENDSIDNTVDILKSNGTKFDGNPLIGHYNNLVFNSQNFKYQKFADVETQDRLEKMCFYRKEFQKMVEGETLRSDIRWDYVCLVDLDLKSLDETGFFSSFSINADVVGANCKVERFGYKELFYDFFAFRKVGDFEPNKNYIRELSYLDASIEPFEVWSVFGGVGIYKFSVFLEGTYDFWASEHVPFHESLRNKGHKIFINPAMITWHHT